MRGERLLLATALLGSANGQAGGSAFLMQLSGACDYNNFLNGLRFQREGFTKTGAPYYKAQTQEYYIYYDPACMGGHDGTSRWIIDNNKPSLTRDSDLDEDHDCSFHARVDSTDKAKPPEEKVWTMYCNGKYIGLTLKLDVLQATPPTSTTAVSTTVQRLPAWQFQISGACNYLNYLNGMIFERTGNTASGAPYYRSTTQRYFIYYDPDCQGATEGYARWIIDNDAPSLTRTEDLDNDQDCLYQARTDSTDISQPPASATWRMNCVLGMEDHLLTLTALTTTRTSTGTTVTATTATATTATTTTLTTSTATTTVTTTGTATTVTATTMAPPTTAAPVATVVATSMIAGSTAAATTAAATETSTSTAAPATLAATTSVVTEAATTLATTKLPALCSTYTCDPGAIMRSNVSHMPAGPDCCKAKATTPLPAATTAKGITDMHSTAAPSTTTITATSTATATTTAGKQTPPMYLRLSGACGAQSALDGLVFERRGFTASGAPYYKAHDSEAYIFHDLDCNNGGKPARWIIDISAPDTNASSDLDKDGGCSYTARVDSNASFAPPSASTWRMNCDGKWQDAALKLAVVSGLTNGTTKEPHGHGNSTHHAGVPAAVVFHGGCDYVKNLRGKTFEMVGKTVSGAPYYKVKGEDFYIYYDPDCAANGRASRWIIDDSAPDTTVLKDLDKDKDCKYLARVNSVNASAPPASARWKMVCKDGWAEESIRLDAPYTRLTEGSCEEAGLAAIGAAGDCTAAATFLGLTTEQAWKESGSPRPEGCYWDAGKKHLYVSVSAKNEGKGAMGSLQPICGGHHAHETHGKKAGQVLSASAGLLPKPLLLALALLLGMTFSPAA